MMPTNYMQLLQPTSGGRPKGSLGGLLPDPGFGTGGATGVTGDPRMGQGQLGGIPTGGASGPAYQGGSMPMGGQGWGQAWNPGQGMHPIVHHIIRGLLGGGHNPNMQGPPHPGLGFYGQGGMGGIPMGRPQNPQTQMFLQYLAQVLGQR